MIVFATIGFIVAFGIGCYLLIGGIGAIRATLGFTGTLKSMDGALSIGCIVAGIVIVAVALYFSPFHVSVST